MVSCNPPAPGCVQLEMIFKLGGQLMENVFHLQKTGGGAVTHADMVAIAHNAAANVGAGPWQNMSSICIFQRAQVRDISAGPGGDVVVDTTNAGLAGVNGGTGFPNNSALAVTLHTALGGRSGRGRFYLGGISTNGMVDQNVMGTALATGIQTHTNDWFTAVQGATGYVFGVLSKWHNKACRATALFTPVTSVSVDTTLDSQRRRLPGRGK